MSNKLFQFSKWLAIIFFFPTIILSILNLINSFWLENSLGAWIEYLSDFCLNILAASFILAVILALAGKKKND